MPIRRLRIHDFRCFEKIDIAPGNGINVITGDNASGKTSVLEAIFFLGRGQSFRQSGPKPAIRRPAPMFTLHAEIDDGRGGTHRIGVQRTRSAIAFSMDGASNRTRLDLVNALPLQLVDPNVHRLLEQGPRYRRHFMDWGVFHVEPLFFPAWQRYRRALRQRNRALKARAIPTAITAWDAELVRHGERVDAARRAYIQSIQQGLPEQARRVLGSAPVGIDYNRGWRGEAGLGAALAAGLDQDRKAGFTLQGPHRADMRVSVGCAAARDWVSRGQQKVLTVALLLVQARLLYRRRGRHPVLLIDDLAAELGPHYRGVLIDEIVRLGGQCFITFLEPGLIPASLNDARMFHVERGRVTGG